MEVADDNDEVCGGSDPATSVAVDEVDDDDDEEGIAIEFDEETDDEERIAIEDALAGVDGTMDEKEAAAAGSGLSVIHLQAPVSAIFTSNLTLVFLSIFAAIMETFFM